MMGEMVLVLDHGDMEDLWENTSFAKLVENNPFEEIWESQNGWPYQKHSLSELQIFNPDTETYSKLEYKEELITTGVLDDSEICAFAIEEWIARGLIPDCQVVLVERDW
jgi:hypothetical protein